MDGALGRHNRMSKLDDSPVAVPKAKNEMTGVKYTCIYQVRLGPFCIGLATGIVLPWSSPN